MNNDNFRRDREEEDRRDRRDREERRDDRREERRDERREDRQDDRFDRPFFDQFGPGRFPTPPIPPIPPRMEEPQFDRMRMEGPRTAPPNFVPQFEEERFGRRRDIRSCINRFTFIWLNNGNSFWFYPVFVGRDQVVGFRWRRNGWMFDRLNLRRISGFRCF